MVPVTLTNHSLVTPLTMAVRLLTMLVVAYVLDRSHPCSTSLFFRKLVTIQLSKTLNRMLVLIPPRILPRKSKGTTGTTVNTQDIA